MLTVKMKKVRKCRALSLIWGICTDVKPMYAAMRRRRIKAPEVLTISTRAHSRRWNTYPRKGVVYALPLLPETDPIN